MSAGHGTKTEKTGEQSWGTPPELFRGLESLFGPFDVDLAASPENAKCERFYTVEDDSLSQDWTQYKSMWANPPYQKVRPWLEKAIEAAREGSNSVWLLKASVNSKWFSELVLGEESARFWLFEKRINFVDPIADRVNSNIESMLVTYGHGRHGSSKFGGTIDSKSGAVLRRF